MGEDGGPGEGWGGGWVRDDPKLLLWVENDGDGFEEGGSDGPAAGEDFDGVIGRAAAAELESEVEIAEGWERRGREFGAVFLEGDLPGVVGGEAGGAAAVVGIVPGDLLGEEGVGGGEVGDGGGAQEGDEAVLEGAEAALDLAFGLRIGGDTVGDAQAEQRPLELRADIVGTGVRSGPEEGEAVGVIGARSAVGGDGGAGCTKVRPGGFVRDEGAGDDFAGMIVEGENEDGLGGGGPPVVRGRIVLPKFADGAGLPAAARFGAWLWGGCGESGQMLAAPRGDGGAGAMEVEAAGEFIGEEGEVERAAVWEKLGGESGSLRRPRLGVIAPAGLGRESARLFEPAVAQGVELSAADFETGAGRGGVAAACIEVVEDSSDESRREAMAELLFIIGCQRLC